MGWATKKLWFHSQQGQVILLQSKSWNKVHPFNFSYWSQDINFNSILVCHLIFQSGITEQRSTNSCLFCCQKGTIIVSAHLKRRAYAPGENILISADIVNMSNTPIQRSCAKLIQVCMNTLTVQSTKKLSSVLLTCMKKRLTWKTFRNQTKSQVLQEILC